MDPRDLELMASFGEWGADVPSTSPLQPVQGLWRTARDKTRAVLDRRAELAADQRFTSTGRQQALQELATSTLQALQDAGVSVLSRAQQALTTLDAKLVAPIGGAPVGGAGDAAAAAIRAVEVRNWLRSVPEAQRHAAISDAITNGDTLVVDAVLNAPRFMRDRLVLPGLQDDLRERWRRSRNPEAAAQARDLESGIARAQQALDTARRIISEQAGLAPAVPAAA